MERIINECNKRDPYVLNVAFLQVGLVRVEAIEVGVQEKLVANRANHNHCSGNSEEDDTRDVDVMIR